MTQRGRPIPPVAPPHSRPANELPSAVADRQNRQISDLLRKGAEAREKVERARSSHDELAIRREAAAMLVLVRSQARPKGRHYSPASPRRSRGPTAPSI